MLSIMLHIIFVFYYILGSGTVVKSRYRDENLGIRGNLKLGRVGYHSTRSCFIYTSSSTRRQICRYMSGQISCFL